MRRSPLSIVVLSTVLAAGCGAASALGVGDTTTSSSSGAASSSGSGVTSVTSGGAGGGSTTSSTTSSSGVSFPTGVFAERCGAGNIGPNGNTFPNTIGIIAGASLTLSQQGSSVVATLSDPAGPTGSFTFEPTTDSSAVLAGTGGVVGGLNGMCVQGPGAFDDFPATLTVASGALTYQAGTTFLSITGTVAGGQNSVCGASSAPETLWFACADTTGTAPAPPTPVPVPAPAFPVGTYTCKSGIATFDQVGPTQEYGASGQAGTLTLTQTGARVTASYTADPTISGTLDFTVTTSSSALAEPGQALLTPCLLPVNQMGPPPADTQVPEAFAVAAGSLAMNGTTLVLSVSGAMTATGAVPSSCPGAVKMASLVCTK
jgi:hypothetical protein